MNTPDANKLIEALNQIAQGVVMLAAAIEDTAWGSFEDHAGASGARPMAAVQLAQPPLREATAGHSGTRQGAPTRVSRSGAGPASASLEDIRAILADLSARGMTSKVKALITAAGAEKLSQVDPSKYEWLLEQSEELINAQ